MQADQAPFILSFSPQDEAQTPPRASKKGKKNKKSDDDDNDDNDDNGLRTEQDSGNFSPNAKGDLKVNFKKYVSANKVQVKKATFSVAKKSIDAPVDISMVVTSGTTLGDVSVKFIPEGQVFRPDAELELVLRGDNLPEVTSGYHAHGSTVESIDVSYDRRGRKHVTLIMSVPGFSRYSLGGGA